MRLFYLFAALAFSGLFAAGSDQSPYSGNWAFQLPDGNPAWLQVIEGGDGTLSGSLLWSVGSARPVRNFAIQNDALVFERKIQWKPFGESENTQVIDRPMEARLSGEGTIKLRFDQHPLSDPEKRESITMEGKRMPPFPQKPDLAAVKFGEAKNLLDENSLKGWRLSNSRKKNGWRVENGILINETPKTDFTAYGEYGNLITDEKFGDFRLTIDYNVPGGGNSGIYLRGMYEAQVVDRDSKMQGISGPGAIFGRLAPSENAGKPGGEWNRYVLTLVDRHITVELNGKTVIDQKRLEGCTGGGISADDTAPGPIFLQGDHTAVKYRNIVIEPVIR